MMTTLCERCFPGWEEAEVLTHPPLLPCMNCNSMGKRHIFRNDPRKQSIFAGKQMGPIPRDGAALDNPHFCKALLAIVVKWNDGNPLVFSQDDFDSVAGSTLLEGFAENGMFAIGIEQRKDVDVNTVPGSNSVN